jgi:branched-chain amino acid transport system permease protein
MDLMSVFSDAVIAAIGVSAAAFALSAVGLNVHFGYTGLLNFGQVGFMMVGAYGLAITVNKGGPAWLGVVAGVFLALLVIAFVRPFVQGRMPGRVETVALIGGGLVLAVVLSLWVQDWDAFWLGVPIGLVASTLLALLLGVPTLRLRADYLAIVTIAAAEIIRLLARTETAEPLTRGVFGIQQFANRLYALNPFANTGRYGWGDFTVTGRQLWIIVIGWSMVGLATMIVWLLMRSPWGRVLKSIREDEDAARSLGKNVFAYKLQSLILGGAFGALAGMLLAVNTQAVAPDTFVALVTFYVWAVLILGGAGTVVGPVVGSIVFWFAFVFIDGFLDEALGAGWFPDGVTSTDLGAVRFALVGLALMLLMIFRPQGIFGNREELMLDER